MPEVIREEIIGVDMKEAIREVLPTDQQQGFENLFTKYLDSKVNPSINWENVEPPKPETFLKHEELEPCPNDMKLKHELFDKIVILKLNGGLGATMGLHGPKSALEIRNDKTFLDYIVTQVEYLNSFHGVDVPLVLMNSFNTHEQTVKVIRKYRKHNISIHTFNQSSYPLILKDTMQVLPTKPLGSSSTLQEYEVEKNLWYPPGHGDIYFALFQSGLLDNLVKQGKEYIFISNVDNLGATVDLSMLYHMINEEIEFMMEVTKRSETDGNTGGTLIDDERGMPHLLELSQVPREHRQKFKSKGDFTKLNTNSLWADLRAIQSLMAENAIQSEPIVKERQVMGFNTIQLETAAGAAMRFFKNSRAVSVPRSRYIPVKSTSDLMLLQSNLYNIKNGTVEIHPSRAGGATPLIKLGEEFSSIEGYTSRIQGKPPGILELDRLTVSGNVSIGKDVTLKGTVVIMASEGSCIEIPDGSTLHNKVVAGNLRILDH